MTPEEVEALKAHLGQQASLSKDIDGIIEVGHAHYGRATFDEASQVVAEALGEKANGVMSVLRGFDKPHDAIVHLANNESQLKALAKLSPERQAIELARIEMRMAPNGHVSTGADPAWKNPEMKGARVSDEDWSRGYGSNLSDRQWNKEFDRRQAARQRR